MGTVIKSQEEIFSTLRSEVEKVSAIETAELFLSAAMDERLLIESTREPGPSLWIVNRSDVCNRSLEILCKHPITHIAERAGEKIKNRLATITNIAAPLLGAQADFESEELSDYGAEDILGHPLCPWEAMLFFSKSLSEDQRASACLSLTRRLWEHPHQSQDFFILRDKFLAAFYPLAESDPSEIVRAYAARTPHWNESDVENFVSKEKAPRILAKWAQNASFSIKALNTLVDFKIDDLHFRRVRALDNRLIPDQRKFLLNSSHDLFEDAIHSYFLGALS